MAYNRQQQPQQSDADLETMAEAELSRLKRQYRIMENDRIAYAEDAKIQLHNQQHMIERMEHEKYELVLAIKNTKSTLNAHKDEVMKTKLMSLLKKRDEYIELIKQEKQQVTELQEQILKLSKEVTSMKMKVPTDSQSKEIALRQKKLVNILEDRLEVATKRFNVVVTDNAKLREEINSLVKERAQFNALWSKLISQLDTGKGIINDLIEQATVAFNQRDEELNKVHALREKGEKDLKNHASEMCELQRTLDNEMKLQEFLGVKGQFRETADLNAKKEAAKKAKREELERKTKVYTETLAQIKKFTGEEEIEKLIGNFVKQEEENFALFSYVNELNDEVEGLEARVTELRAAIDEARALNIHRGERQTETLEKLSQQLETQTELATKAEKDSENCNVVMNALLNGIETLFESMRCDKSPILELLGDNSHVTRNNVMLYLGLIEKRITEMFNKVHWLDTIGKKEMRLDEDKKPKFVLPLLSDMAPTQPCALCVEKEEMQHLSENLDVPLTREGAKEKLSVRLKENVNKLLHNVSGCRLPAARKIIQKRYQ